MRAFLAIAIASEARAALKKLQESFGVGERDVRWVDSAQAHITLKFLGHVAEDQSPLLAACMQEVAKGHPCFEASLANLGGFPSLRRPLVLWVGMEKGAAQLSALARDVERAVAQIGFAPEERPFHPHVTLARIESPQALRRIGEAACAMRFNPAASWQVASFILYRSHLSRTGARYEILADFPLTRPSSSA